MRRLRMEMEDGSIVESYLPPSNFDPASASTEDLHEYGYVSALREYGIPGTDLLERIATHTTRILPAFDSVPLDKMPGESEQDPSERPKAASVGERGGPVDDFYWAGAVTAPLEPARPEEGPRFDKVVGSFTIPSVDLTLEPGGAVRNTAMAVAVGMDKYFNRRYDLAACIGYFTAGGGGHYHAYVQFRGMSFGSWLSNFPCAAGDDMTFVVEKWPPDTRSGTRVQMYNNTTRLSTVIELPIPVTGTDAQWLVVSPSFQQTPSVLSRFETLKFTTAVALTDAPAAVYPSTGWTFRMRYRDETLASSPPVSGAAPSEVTVMFNTHGQPRVVPYYW